MENQFRRFKVLWVALTMIGSTESILPIVTCVLGARRLSRQFYSTKSLSDINPTSQCKTCRR